MGKIEPFEVEEWMDEHENSAKYNIAETCCASISISDLLSLSETPNLPSPIPTTTKLTYGAIRGSDDLRNNIASLYSARSSSCPPLTKEDILITPGAIAANFLVFYTLLSPGDHVICHYPTYSQLYQVPRSLGADVTLWKTRPESGWQLDPSTLAPLIQPNTKLLILNNPNNPTGSIIPKPTLEAILTLASSHSLAVLVDEVYRPLFHSLSPASAAFPPSAINTPHLSLIVTSSLSKSFSLAGLRLGWLATRSPALLAALAGARHYTTISVSALDEAVAATALSDHCVHALLARNLALARTNLELLEGFVEEFGKEGVCGWVRPVAGTTAFVWFKRRGGGAVDDVRLCEMLMQTRGVMMVPGGRCFGDKYGVVEKEGGEGEGEGEFAGYVRIGFVNSTEVLTGALEELRAFMREESEGVPLACERNSKK